MRKTNRRRVNRRRVNRRKLNRRKMNRRKMNTTSVNVEMNNGAEFIEKISTVNSDDSIASGKQMNNSSETLSRLLNVPNP